ncbi:hypothetical protein NPIL_580791 [Nephila pilipes]|uniref:Uncharacterized protein n=1 Tax=Nephila pilipes TaxID=299642 RepID=A0A8X6QHT3_NEPPI|nr:hypothetical protein NPIL_580791 [Nephila pilipes]
MHLFGSGQGNGGDIAELLAAGLIVKILQEQLMVSVTKFFSVLFTVTFLDLIVFEDSPISEFVSDYAYFYDEYFDNFLQLDFLKLLY